MQNIFPVPLKAHPYLLWPTPNYKIWQTIYKDWSKKKWDWVHISKFGRNFNNKSWLNRPLAAPVDRPVKFCDKIFIISKLIS